MLIYCHPKQAHAVLSPDHAPGKKMSPQQACYPSLPASHSGIQLVSKQAWADGSCWGSLANDLVSSLMEKWKAWIRRRSPCLVHLDVPWIYGSRVTNLCKTVIVLITENSLFLKATESSLNTKQLLQFSFDWFVYKGMCLFPASSCVGWYQKASRACLWSILWFMKLNFRHNQYLTLITNC